MASPRFLATAFTLSREVVLYSGSTVGGGPGMTAIPVSAREERTMALVPLATKGNYFHVYDFRVKAGRGDE